MGTDIHMRAEIRLTHASPWEALGSVFPNDNYDPIEEATTIARDRAEGKDMTEYVSYRGAPTTNEPYRHRNYNLFAALSGVRNGVGFAGIPTGKPLKPSVAAGRGLPDDLARHVDEELYCERVECDEWDSDEQPEKLSNTELAKKLYIFGEHSHGWITLEEILAYDWDYAITHFGFLPAAEYRRCYESGFKLRPRVWSSDICDGNSMKLDCYEANCMIRAGEFPEAAGDAVQFNVLAIESPYHVYYSWSNKLRECTQDFLDVVDKMRHWGKDYKIWHRDGNGMDNPKATMHDPSCIRLVFGYDS